MRLTRIHTSLLPLSRINAQIWRQAAISLTWPFVVYPLVAARRKKVLGLEVVLEALVLADVFFWGGFGLAALEIVDESKGTELAIIFSLLFVTSCVHATFYWWYGNRLATLLLFATSFAWSAFYWTPMGLLYAIQYDYTDFKRIKK